jgi:hypothetical protein
MKFNFWFVIFLALMPVFVLFVGLSAAGGFASSADLKISGVLVAAALAAGYLAKRGFAENVDCAPAEATPTEDASTPAHDRENGSALGYASPPYFVAELDPLDLGDSTREEVPPLVNQLPASDRSSVRSVEMMSERPARRLEVPAVSN